MKISILKDIWSIKELGGEKCVAYHDDRKKDDPFY